MNVARHDSDLAFARRNDARTIRADQARRTALHEVAHLNHVGGRDAFGDADHQRHTGLGRFHDSIGRERRWNENHRCVRARLLHRIGDGIEDRQTQMRLTALTRSDAAHYFRAVIDGRLGMKAGFAPGESLEDYTGVLIHQDAHLASLTTFSAASFMPSATVELTPDPFKVSCAFSTLVPSMRTTIGTFTLNSRAALTTPVASTSQRKMPPKMLIKTAFTPWSERRILNAFLICSALAPPPTSRKFAGLPPAYLMMSMVAIARPAPLTMQAIVPSDRKSTRLNS